MCDTEQKCEEIFILIKIAGMTLTEVNTLTDNERFHLSKFFLLHYKEEQNLSKNK